MTRFTGLLMALFLFASCGPGSSKEQKEENPASENEIDAARNFIRAALDGKWDKARTFMIQDSANTQLIDRFEQRYEQSMEREKKRGYRESNIVFYDTRKLSDSAFVVNYSNTFMKERDSLKVVRVDNRWLVDPKYTLISGSTEISVEDMQLRDSLILNRKQ